VKIGNYILRRSSTIKKRLINTKRKDKIVIARTMQIYQCRMFGVCFYRSENSYEKLKKEINRAISEVIT
jgi:hypothetical protein